MACGSGRHYLLAAGFTIANLRRSYLSFERENDEGRFCSFCPTDGFDRSCQSGD
jgi:hypothetical protein